MSATQSRHASREPLAVRIAVPIGVLFTAIASLLALVSGPLAAGPAAVELPAPAAAMALPDVQQTAAPAADPCADDAVKNALSAGDDAATVLAFGGGAAFRAAVVAGNAPCISLLDPEREWVVVNKLNALSPLDYAPSVTASSLRGLSRSVSLRPAAADALSRMGDAARAAGAGSMGVNNAYRSYGLQQITYSRFVRSEGESKADAGSARPGHSEHQTGLAVDVVACGGGCSGLGAFGTTSQSRWVVQHGWEYGFIVRYEDGATQKTGYMPEPWHLRYIGVELAKAYHEGGFHTLEDFFGLPPAPDYAR
ncbi:M15 family metallopeptidase [Microbacterium sp. ARD32]|uniref:M15 family metallopeptidase n=1 Tax=Microbacterium sp. ARD32 TaxID=2962577 RepID=UPI0028810E18|nr:M15 family metallopeptidase [Microbacterium sp. ARD32]MDT0156104.1 M15 family metallopeptidase [Microbacterium sp. ARD32]